MSSLRFAFRKTLFSIALSSLCSLTTPALSAACTSAALKTAAFAATLPSPPSWLLTATRANNLERYSVYNPNNARLLA